MMKKEKPILLHRQELSSIAFQNYKSICKECDRADMTGYYCQTNLRYLKNHSSKQMVKESITLTKQHQFPMYYPE